METSKSAGKNSGALKGGSGKLVWYSAAPIINTCSYRYTYNTSEVVNHLTD